jgi:hypothetical protein
LETTFNRDGVIGGTSLIPVIEAERGFGEAVDARLRGHLVLSESFQNFLFDTVRLGEGKWRSGKNPQGHLWYGVMVLECAALFRALRAADILLHAGYPLDGFSLLRDVRDRAIFLAGVGNGIVTLKQLGGYPEADVSRGALTEETWAQSRRQAEAVERDTLRRTIGTDSGLPDATVDELRRWTDLFHLEVHGSRLTRASEFHEWFTGRNPLPLAPALREQSLAVFANRFVEVSWMVLRCLPLLQLASGAFGEEWAHRWTVLDDSFRHDAEDLWRMGKPIEGAIIHMIDTKLAFTPRDFYV